MNEENLHKGLYAVIPARVRYDVNLKDKAKLLYGEISALSNEKGYCWASNKYFADLYNVSTTTISLLIKNLIDSGYLKSILVYKEGTKEIKNRYLIIVNEGIEENLKTYLKKLKDPPQEKLKENNTSINNINNNNIYKTLIEFYNNLDIYPKILKLTKKREDKIKERLKDVGYDNLIKAFKEGTKSDFLTGKNKDSKWKADFDWFIANDTNAIKVLEGKYSNKPNESKNAKGRMYGPILN